MKQYVVDQLRLGDYQKLKEHMDRNYGPARMDGLYWVALDKSALNTIQKQHVSCAPHVFAVELCEARIVCELLLRTMSRMRCECMGYADAEQVLAIMKWLDCVLDLLEIKV